MPNLAIMHKGKEYVCIVNDVDAHLLTTYTWCIIKKKSKGDYNYYVVRNDPPIQVYLHHEIVGRHAGYDVDHINGNGLDCTRGNLRVATHSQNIANQQPKPNRYKGVYTSGKKWRAQITLNNVQTYLGSYTTPEEAALAYDAAARTAFGEFAVTNFRG